MGIIYNNAPMDSVSVGSSPVIEVVAKGSEVMPVIQDPTPPAPVGFTYYVYDRFVDNFLTPLPLHVPDIDLVATGWQKPTYAYEVLTWYNGLGRVFEDCAHTFGYNASGFVSGNNTHLIDVTGMDVGAPTTGVIARYQGNINTGNLALTIFAGNLTTATDNDSIKVDRDGIWLVQSAGDTLVQAATWTDHDNFVVDITRNVATGDLNINVDTFCGDMPHENVVVAPFSYTPNPLASFNLVGFDLNGRTYPRCCRFEAKRYV